MTRPTGDDPLQALLASVERLAEAAQGGTQPLPAELESTDSTGAVTVTLADHGQRVTRVLVAANWQSLVTPEALGAAVLEAVVAPQLAAAQDFFAAIGDGSAAGGTESGAPATLSPADPEVVARVSRLDWDDLSRMMATVQHAFDRLAAMPAPQPEAAGVVGSSANRMVRVSLVAGQAADVAVDERWAARATRQSLCDSLREAFEAAYAEQAAHASHAAQPDAPVDGALLGELQSIVELFGGRVPAQDEEERPR